MSDLQARERAAAAEYERDRAEAEREAQAEEAAMSGGIPAYPAWHAGTVGYIFGIGGLMTGFLMLALTIICAAGLLPLLPAFATLKWGLLIHAAHWGSWALCIWIGALRNRGFLLFTLAVHAVAWLANVTAFFLVLIDLLINGIDAEAIILWAGLIAAIFLVLSSAVLASLWTLFVASEKQLKKQKLM
jgi:hypothetical protein